MGFSTQTPDINIRVNTSTQTPNTCPFISLLDQTDTPLTKKLRTAGTSFNIDQMGRTRVYAFEQCVGLGMEGLRKLLFGTDEEKEAANIKREEEFMLIKMLAWTERMGKSKDKVTAKELKIDASALMEGLKTRTPKERRPFMSILHTTRGVTISAGHLLLSIQH